MIKPALHHVNLTTTQLDALIDWYGKVAGLAPTHRAANGAGAWLTNDAANHRLALLAIPGLVDDPKKAAHTGLHHIAFEYASLPDLFDSYARLRGIGIEPYFSLDHGMTMSMYYADPDNNLVELQADVFDDWEKSKAFMHTSPSFAANPIGMFFDPALVHAAHAAGTPPQEIHANAARCDYRPDPLPELGLPQRSLVKG